MPSPHQPLQLIERQKAVLLLVDGLDSIESPIHFLFQQLPAGFDGIPVKFITVSMRDKALPLPSSRSKKFAGVSKSIPETSIFEVSIAGIEGILIDSNFSSHQLHAFESKFWRENGLKLDGLNDSQKREILSFALSCRELSQHLKDDFEFIAVDAIGFKTALAGMAVKNALGIPFLFTFDFRNQKEFFEENAIDCIESLALSKSDFVSSFSKSLLKQRIFSLLPTKERSEREASRNIADLEFQLEKNSELQKLLLLENGSSRYAQSHFMPFNAMNWECMGFQEIEKARNLLENLLPGFQKYALLFADDGLQEFLPIAMQAISTARNGKNLGLVIIGSAGQQDVEFARQFAAAMNLSKNLAFYNARIESNVEKAVACAADMLLIPSNSGIELMNALACSIACESNGLSGPIVIASAENQLALDLIKNGVNGFRIPFNFSIEGIDLLANAFGLSLQDMRLHSQVSKGAFQLLTSDDFKSRNFLNWRMKFYEQAIANFQSSKSQESTASLAGFKLKSG